ncbi:hypothetical protein LMG32289_05447 [Cupriavidus pampae]|uniref:Uncharacterized protein n=1 Tax=Cupriavidus pampae TaxID=659251 RepID=A0ABM8XU21_9BURK|nr:hypothetical protein LMG32289_05447 [Cupriavidus pampae]
MRHDARTCVGGPLAAIAALAGLMLGMPAAQAVDMTGTPIAPQAPPTGQRLCGIGSGIALSGSGNLTCSEPTTIPSGAVTSQGAPAAPCQLVNVRIEGALTVECDRMSDAPARVTGGR